MVWTLVVNSETVKPSGAVDRARQCGPDPGLVHIDPADPGGTDLSGQWELVEESIADEGDINTVQGGGEPVDHAGESSDDVGEAVQDATAAQRFGVVCDRFEAQHVFAWSENGRLHGGPAQRPRFLRRK
jgi:hypothetical protein